MYDLPTRVVLNANQRRHFEVLFARLEESLVHVETLMGPDVGRQRTLSVLEDDIADGFREHALPILNGVRELLGQLATSLTLQPRRLSRTRAIAATLNAEAIRIEDSLSPQMRGYGDVHPSIEQQLDPILEKMARTLSALAAASHRPTRSSRGR